jgi:hypothetical protein
MWPAEEALLIPHIHIHPSLVQYSNQPYEMYIVDISIALVKKKKAKQNKKLVA